MFDKSAILNLPHTTEEIEWLEQRLETLSAKEMVIAAAQQKRREPTTAMEAINMLLNLNRSDVYYAPDYASLGRVYLSDNQIELPSDVLAHTDLEQLGKKYEKQHSGEFCEGYYVTIPQFGNTPHYPGQSLDKLADTGWSMKIKLVSETKPDGVWLRLPDYATQDCVASDEIEIALTELGVSRLSQCDIADVECVLPTIDNMQLATSAIDELVSRGSDLGYLLYEDDEYGAKILPKLSAVLDYEECHDLRRALEIGDHLHQYTIVTKADLAEIARKSLVERHVPESFLDSGAIRLEDYARDLLNGQDYWYCPHADIYLKPSEPQQVQTPPSTELTM